MAGKTRRNSRHALIICAAMLVCSGMAVSAEGNKAPGSGPVFQQISDDYSEITVSLQDIVDANTGIENVLGSHTMIGCTILEYDENGEKTSTSQFAITRDGDSYAYAQVENAYILTYKNGSRWVQFYDGTKKVQTMDEEEFAAVMEYVKEFSTVGYSETEVFTAQLEQDGKIYIQSEDPQAEYSVGGNTECFYYVLDPDTLQAEQVIGSIRDADGNETKIYQLTIEYGDGTEE